MTLQGISNSARLEVLMPETGTGKAQEPAGTEREAEGGRGGEREL